MNMSDISTLKKLLGEISDGPWEVEVMRSGMLLVHSSLDEKQQDADAQFIALARNTLPQLIEDYEATSGALILSGQSHKKLRSRITQLEKNMDEVLKAHAWEREKNELGQSRITQLEEALLEAADWIGGLDSLLSDAKDEATKYRAIAKGEDDD